MIDFAEGALVDLERIFEFYDRSATAEALAIVAKIRSAILVLEEHPYIGRPVGTPSRLRELVISHGKTGFLALYAYSELDEAVIVLGIRHQREAGYRGR